MQDWRTNVDNSANMVSTITGATVANTVATAAKSTAPTADAWQHPPKVHAPQSFLNPVRSQPAQATLGMVSARARETMVERLKANGISHPAVLAAMLQIKRHEFVDTAFASRAYDDAALPIGFQQTISQPYIVARMIELALAARASTASTPSTTWLEIGTGCGYQCAVMAQCAPWVCSVERVQGLSRVAEKNLAAAGIRNISLLHGDGLQRWDAQYTSSHAQSHDTFGAIIVAAAGLGVPLAWREQLSIGGRLIAPIKDEQGLQRLMVVDRLSSEQWQEYLLESVQFVPLLKGTNDRE